MTEAVLEVRRLVKDYGPLRAVDGVSFAVPGHCCFGLLGPNGAGKTTTVEIMEGIVEASSGEVLFRGRPLDTRFREEAGIQFQSTALQDFLTVRETLQLFRRLYDNGLDVEDLIELCALSQIADQDARRISGGQRQRLLLAVALVNDPAIVFLDEPTTGLDPQARRKAWELIESIKQRGKTIILTTHYMEEAYVLCDRIAIMDHGRIIAEGSPQTLLKEHYDDVILELPREDFRLDPGSLPWTVLETQGVVEISTPDVEAALRELGARGVPLQRLRIRPRNLEDLFLELTGRELRA